MVLATPRRRTWRRGTTNKQESYGKRSGQRPRLLHTAYNAGAHCLALLVFGSDNDVDDFHVATIAMLFSNILCPDSVYPGFL